MPASPQISSLSLSLSLFFLPWGLQLISTCSISKALLQRLHCCLFIQLWLVFLCELARGLFCSVNRKTSTVNADTCTRFGFGGCNFHFKAQNIISPRRWYVVYCLLFSSLFQRRRRRRLLATQLLTFTKSSSVLLCPCADSELSEALEFLTYCT